jgi:hypothetical protein
VHNHTLPVVSKLNSTLNLGENRNEYSVSSKICHSLSSRRRDYVYICKLLIVSNNVKKNKLNNFQQFLISGLKTNMSITPYPPTKSHAHGSIFKPYDSQAHTPIITLNKKPPPMLLSWGWGK